MPASSKQTNGKVPGMQPQQSKCEFVMEVVKPFIDQEYRTLVDART